jgi:hypothetical protein
MINVLVKEAIYFVTPHPRIENEKAPPASLTGKKGSNTPPIAASEMSGFLLREFLRVTTHELADIS